MSQEREPGAADTTVAHAAAADPPAQRTDSTGPEPPVDRTDNADRAQTVDTADAADTADTADSTDRVDSTERTDDAGRTDSAEGAEDPDSAAEPPDKDPWAAFAPQSAARPGRAGRVFAALGRLAVHEWTLACLGALLLAVVMTWPTLQYPQYTIPQDIWDPTLQAWQMAWSGHILKTDPAQLWHANAFYPERYSFAFSDTLLGYAPAGLLGTGPVAAVLRYNIMYVLLHALAFVGAYALVRQLGSGRVGAAVAGAAFAYAPWRLSQAGHMHVLSTGGIALALAMLARGHGWSLRYGYRPQRRSVGWTIAGWLVATWQISLGFGIGLPFAYLLGVLVVIVPVIWVVRRLFHATPPIGGRLLLTDLSGGLLFAVVGVLLALPYLTVADQHPEARRTVEELRLFSPPLRGFFVAPAESRLWGGLHEPARAALPFQPEMTLLPGFTLYALAAAGLVFSIWTLRQRLLLAAGVVLSLVLAMGTQVLDGRYSYLLLFEHLPGWDGLRTPGRLVVWTTLLLAVLAAGAVTAFVNRATELHAGRIPPWPGPWLRLAMLMPVVLVLAEGVNSTPHPIVPARPEALRTANGPLMVLPSDQLLDENIMLWATDQFPQMVNGGSGFFPVRQQEIRRNTQTFPDAGSVTYLRELGVRTVVVLRDRIPGTPWQAAADTPVDGLGITREEVAGAVVFRLNG